MQDYGGYGSPGGYAPSEAHASSGGYIPYGSYPPPPPPPRRPGLWRYVVVAVVAAAVGAGSVLAIGRGTSPVASPSPSASSPGAQVQPGQLPGYGDGNGISGNGLSSADQAVYSKVAPGLVIIRTALNYQSEQAAGTGMVLTSDGLVLTNNHVIRGATSISATVLATGRTYPAKVLGYDKSGDIAAIQLQGASGLRTVTTGDSSTVKVGDQVLAMGNAQGQSQIVPAPGQVTALNQTISASDQSGSQPPEILHGTIKVNAAIVEGDSGGALANMSGQVIGMNTAGNNVSFDGQPATGFAIPINTALSVVHQITAGQASSTVTIGYPVFVGVFIGGTSSNPQAQAAEQQGSNPFGYGGQTGCVTSNANLAVPSTIAPVSRGTLVVGVICNSPATAVGLAAGDVVTQVNGTPIGGPSDLAAQLSKYKPGDTITLTWVDLNGRSHTASVRLQPGPPQ